MRKGEYGNYLLYSLSLKAAFRFDVREQFLHLFNCIKYLNYGILFQRKHYVGHVFPSVSTLIARPPFALLKFISSRFIYCSVCVELKSCCRPTCYYATCVSLVVQSVQLLLSWIVQIVMNTSLFLPCRTRMFMAWLRI